MLPVGLYDSIEIEEASHPSFISNVPELEGDPSNLVLRAARSFTQAALIDTAYAIRLEKRIPIGAGLGGGSSNAAVTLQLLNKLHGFPLRAEQLEELAANLGSDVAFFLDGRSAWCTGRGERIETRFFPDHLWICLFKPGFAVPTAGAYRAYARLAENLKRGEESVTPWGKLRNDLEPAVLPKYLFLALLKDWLKEQSETLICADGRFGIDGICDRAKPSRRRNASGSVPRTIWKVDMVGRLPVESHRRAGDVACIRARACK